MDTHDSIGKLLTGNEQRDAIHIALLPVQAKIDLRPGEHASKDGNHIHPIGIVDPYLQTTIRPGEWFWLFIYPKTITSLRHVWTHPDLNDLPDAVVFKSMSLDIQKTFSKDWIEKYANNIGIGYEQLLSDADDYVNFGHLSSHGGLYEGHTTDPKFWDHYEVIRDTKVDHRDNFFSCSC